MITNRALLSIVLMLTCTLQMQCSDYSFLANVSKTVFASASTALGCGCLYLLNKMRSEQQVFASKSVEKQASDHSEIKTLLQSLTNDQRTHQKKTDGQLLGIYAPIVLMMEAIKAIMETKASDHTEIKVLFEALRNDQIMRQCETDTRLLEINERVALIMVAAEEIIEQQDFFSEQNQGMHQDTKNRLTPLYELMDVQRIALDEILRSKIRPVHHRKVQTNVIDDAQKQQEKLVRIKRRASF